MNRDFLEVFQTKLKSHKIRANVLAAEAGRNASYLSEVFNRKQSPTMETFKGLIEAADRLSPGFADEYYLALCGRVDVNSIVRSLPTPDLSMLLVLVADLVSDRLVARHQRAA